MKGPSISEALPTKAEAQRLMTVALLVGLLAAAAALMLFMWLGEEVREGDIITVDEGIRGVVHQVASPGLTAFMRAASRYGGPSVLVPAGLVVALAFLIKRWQRGAFLVIVTLAGAGLLNGLLKLYFARLRPEPFFDYPLPPSPSFPSGHALYAACVFGGLAALLSPRLKTHLLRVLVWSAAVLLAGFVGLSRVYLGVHYPSDVLAGFAVGLIWVTAVAFGDRLAQHRRRRRSG
jgi:undecaprenyl-diphosphatase